MHESQTRGRSEPKDNFQTLPLSKIQPCDPEQGLPKGTPYRDGRRAQAIPLADPHSQERNHIQLDFSDTVGPAGVAQTSDQRGSGVWRCGWWRADSSLVHGWRRGRDGAREVVRRRTERTMPEAASPQATIINDISGYKSARSSNIQDPMRPHERDWDW
jgi:hypothetical protein